MELVIGLEGMDGSGKSTVARTIVDFCQERGLRSTICRTGGVLTPWEWGMPTLEPVEAKRLFWENLVTPECRGQYEYAHEMGQSHDVLVLDRTFVSHVMGKTRIYQQPLDAKVLQVCAARLAEWPCYVPLNEMWHIKRAAVAISAGLLQRRNVGEELSGFDRFLVENPDFVVSDCERFRQAISLTNAVVIENDEDLAVLQQKVTDRVAALLSTVGMKSGQEEG